MLRFILTVISTAMTIAILVTKQLLLEALTIKFQASRTLAITSSFFLDYYVFFLMINCGENSYITFLAFL
jgi:hypothetical protein